MPMPFSYNWSFHAPSKACSGNLATALWDCCVCSMPMSVMFGSLVGTHTFRTVCPSISHFMWLPMHTPKHVVEPCCWPFGLHFVLPSQFTSFMLCVYFRHQFIDVSLPVCSHFIELLLPPSRNAVTLWCMPLMGRHSSFIAIVCTHCSFTL